MPTRLCWTIRTAPGPACFTWRAPVERALAAQDMVDAELRVWGLGGLRIADASIMRTRVAGATKAPVVVIAQKAAAWIAKGMPP